MGGPLPSIPDFNSKSTVRGGLRFVLLCRFLDEVVSMDSNITSRQGDLGCL